MANIPKYPNFKEYDDKEINDIFLNILHDSYCKLFLDLKNDDFNINNISSTKNIGSIFYLIEFKKTINYIDEYKFIIYQKIYSSLYNDFENNRIKIYGIFNGEIKNSLSDKDIFTMKSEKIKNNMINKIDLINKEYNKMSEEIYNLKISDLKQKCIELNLKKNGLKLELIENIINYYFNFNNFLKK